MIGLDIIREVHKKFWKPGYGSISAKEAYFIQQGIAEYKPKRFLEIGTASGLSTGFIGMFLSQNDGEEVVTLDIDKVFWADQTKETGFLAKDICDGDIKITYIREKDSTYLQENYIEDKFDMAFVDANHQHPWPVLDMIAVLPLMKKGALIYHHDLALYKNQTPIYGVGPKYLFDQIPEYIRCAIKEVEKNIYYIKTPDNYMDLAPALIDALYLPWTIRKKIPESIFDKYKYIAKRYWNEDLVDALEKTAGKFMKA